MSKSKLPIAFITLVVLFFMWGFLTSLNDILVPYVKEVFELKNWQAQLIQFFFFGAYFVMSWPSGYIIKKLGYQKGIVTGLALMGLGCLMFIPAAMIGEYFIFLLALFILASGITILQVAANPYVAALGPESTSASRLNLAQGFNSLGHTLAPIFGTFLILESLKTNGVEAVNTPYIILGAVLILLSLAFFFIKLPALDIDEKDDEKFSLLKYPHLLLGGIAIFFYVGAEISVGSMMVEYIKLDKVLGISAEEAGYFVSYYWAGAMIGRFLGAISLSKGANKLIQMIGVIAIALFVILAVNGFDFTNTNFLYFAVVLALNFVAFNIGNSIPSRMLAIFAGFAVLMIIVSMNTTGYVALWSLLSIGLFNSIMWSNIFTLAIKKLGKFTSYGSSLLVMMIVGGAIIPVIQGVVADGSLGVNYSFIVPAFAYLYLIFYGAAGHKIGLNE